MNTNYSAIINKGLVGLAFGLTAILGVAAQALAASDYKVIEDGVVALGDWQDHAPARVIRFYLPATVDPHYRSVLQMNLNSTNKSWYNAIYLNPEFLPGEGEGCDNIHHDRNALSRIDLLPYTEHDRWSVYHKTISGAPLLAGDNYLLICSRNEHGEGVHGLDNFWVKDIVLHYREYQPAPEFCTAVYEPVCGVDGLTYSNACEAEQAGVEIRYGDACPVQ